MWIYLNGITVFIITHHHNMIIPLSLHAKKETSEILFWEKLRFILVALNLNFFNEVLRAIGKLKCLSHTSRGCKILFRVSSSGMMTSSEKKYFKTFLKVAGSSNEAFEMWVVEASAIIIARQWLHLIWM